MVSQEGLHLKRPANSFAAHPSVVFGAMWSLVFVAYGAKLSYQLTYDIWDYAYLYVAIVVSFVLSCGIGGSSVSASSAAAEKQRRHSGFRNTRLIEGPALDQLVRKLHWCFGLWCVATVGEVVTSGGVPALWFYQGSGKQASDFGITSIHGLLMSLVLACATFSYYLFKVTGRKQFAIMTVFTVIWCVTIVSRNFLIALLLQILFVKITLARISARQIGLVALAGLAIVVTFGVLGDFRTGSEDLILAVGQPTDSFPSWLPSGFLWVYIYITTPLNNLINNIEIGRHGAGYSILSTTANLLPTVVRTAIYPPDFLEQGELIDPNLNVSTAYLAPFLDAGIFGIALYSAFAGAIAGWFWARRFRPFFLLGYAFIGQTLILSVFFNQFLFLPYLMQLVWFAVLLRNRHGLLHWVAINPRRGADRPFRIVRRQSTARREPIVFP